VLWWPRGEGRIGGQIWPPGASEHWARQRVIAHVPRRAVTVMRSQTALVLILLALVALAGVLWLPGLGDLASVP